MSKVTLTARALRAIRAISLLLFIFVITGCGPIREQEFPLGCQAYLFEPQKSMELKTVLNSLMPVDCSVADSYFKVRYPPIVWSQKQFVDLATALVDDEIKQGAKLRGISWYMPCAEVNFGPQDYGLKYYRIGIAQGRRLRIEISVWLKPRNGTLEISKTGFDPPIYPYPPGDLEFVNSAEELLRSAEDAGGQDFRESVSNNCDVDGYSSEVEYTSVGGKALQFYFDLKTGKLKEIRTFPSSTPAP